jgi:hypothetical protein
VVVEALHAVGQQPHALQEVVAIIGLNTLSSKLPLAPPMLMATSLPITWAQSMVSASHWVGLTLPGMMEEPGSFPG